jgi:hypothetical protein
MVSKSAYGNQRSDLILIGYRHSLQVSRRLFAGIGKSSASPHIGACAILRYWAE